MIRAVLAAAALELDDLAPIPEFYSACKRECVNKCRAACCTYQLKFMLPLNKTQVLKYHRENQGNIVVTIIELHNVMELLWESDIHCLKYSYSAAEIKSIHD